LRLKRQDDVLVRYSRKTFTPAECWPSNLKCQHLCSSFSASTYSWTRRCPRYRRYRFQLSRHWPAMDLGRT